MTYDAKKDYRVIAHNYGVIYLEKLLKDYAQRAKDIQEVIQEYSQLQKDIEQNKEDLRKEGIEIK